jgi:hypothetical protein
VRVVWCSASAAIVALAGCGVGGGLAASAGGSGGGGGGGGPPPSPKSTVLYGPRLADETGAKGSVVRFDAGRPAGVDAKDKDAHPAGNLVVVRFFLAHVHARRVGVTPEYRIGTTGDWRAMTLVKAPGFLDVSGPVDVKKCAKSVEPSVLWNSAADLPRLSDDNPTSRFITYVRVRFDDVDGTTEVGSRFPPTEYVVDLNLAGPIASDASSSLPSGKPVPAGLALDEDGLLVACAKADIVDHVAAKDGAVARRIGRGEFLPPDRFQEPGVDVANADDAKAAVALQTLLTRSAGDPAGVQPRAILGLAAGAGGAIFTANHYFIEAARFDASAPLLTVVAPTPMTFGVLEGPLPFPYRRCPGYCHRPAYDAATRALLYSDTRRVEIRNPATGAQTGTLRENRILAVDPFGSGDVDYYGRVLSPTAATPLYVEAIQYPFDGSSLPRTRIHELVVGPAGEVYFDSRSAGNEDFVKAFNPTAVPATVGAVVIPPGEARVVAGPYVIVDPSEPPDDRDASSWDDVQDVGHDQHEFLSLAVAKTARALFVAVPRIHDQKVYAVALDADAAVAPTFCGTPIPAAGPEVRGSLLVAESGTDSAKSACVALDLGDAKNDAREIEAPINAVEADDSGTRLFVAHSRDVFFVNGGQEDVTDFGRSGGLAVAPKKTAVVYTGENFTGLAIDAPRGVAARDDGVVFFSDHRVIRALNLGSAPVRFGTTDVELSVPSGAYGVVAGAALAGAPRRDPTTLADAVEPAVQARFDSPAALAVSPQNELYVADTQNDRVRLIHVGDPRSADPIFKFGTTIAPGYAATIAGAGAAGAAPYGDQGPARDSTLSKPEGIALWRKRGVVFVSDTGHHAVRAMNAGTSTVSVAGTSVDPGEIRTVVGDIAKEDGGAVTDGLLNAPCGLAVDSTDGADARDLLFFADRADHRIAVLNLGTDDVDLWKDPDDPSVRLSVAGGQVAVVCGTGEPGNDGDGGFALDAKIDEPRGLAVAHDPTTGALTALYFTDGKSGRLRVVALSSGRLTIDTDGDGRYVFDHAALPGRILTLNSNPVPASPPSASDADVPGVGIVNADPTTVGLSAPFGLAILSKDDSGAVPVHGPTGVLVADQAGNRLIRFPFARVGR